MSCLPRNKAGLRIRADVTTDVSDCMVEIAARSLSSLFCYIVVCCIIGLLITHSMYQEDVVEKDLWTVKLINLLYGTNSVIMKE